MRGISFHLTSGWFFYIDVEVTLEVVFLDFWCVIQFLSSKDMSSKDMATTHSNVIQKNHIGERFLCQTKYFF